MDLTIFFYDNKKIWIDECHEIDHNQETGILTVKYTKRDYDDPKSARLCISEFEGSQIAYISAKRFGGIYGENRKNLHEDNNGRV